MIYRKQPGKSNALLNVGLSTLIIANVTRYFWKPAHVSQPLTDGVTGLLFGIAIGCLLFALRRRHTSCDMETPVAK